jgi:hypothetical protein
MCLKEIVSKYLVWIDVVQAVHCECDHSSVLGGEFPDKLSDCRFRR